MRPWFIALLIVAQTLTFGRGTLEAAPRRVSALDVALIRAAQEGQTQTVVSLLKRGANVNATGKRQPHLTPLM